MNNELIEATNGILNNEATTNENNLLNVNNDVFDSAISSQLGDMMELKSNLSQEQEKARILQQRANEEKRHKEAITAQQAQMNVLSNNNNNNDDEKMLSLQTNYQIEENNRKEERENDKTNTISENH